ncbi:MAG: hypothetical protein AAGA69_10580 [Pseudomonadota bacterium]
MANASKNGARQVAAVILIVVGLANADYAVFAKADAPEEALPLYIAGAVSFGMAAVLQLTGRKA